MHSVPRTTRIRILGVAFGLVAIAGTAVACGGGSTKSSTPASAPASQSASPQPPGSSSVSSATNVDPCGLLHPDEVEAVLGVAPSGGPAAIANDQAMGLGYSSGCIITFGVTPTTVNVLMPNPEDYANGQAGNGALLVLVVTGPQAAGLKQQWEQSPQGQILPITGINGGSWYAPKPGVAFAPTAFVERADTIVSVMLLGHLYGLQGDEDLTGGPSATHLVSVLRTIDEHL